MAEHYTDIIADCMKFAFKIKGKQGPITIDTNLAKHNIFLDETVDSQETIDRLEKEDVIVLGANGKLIEYCELEIFIIKLKKNLKIVDNGRSYFFEGIHVDRNDPNKYYIHWGS